MTDTDTLNRLYQMAEIMAGERTNDHALAADAAQEGRIAAWTTLNSHPGKPHSYYVASVRRGVTNVLRGRPYTGQTSQRGCERVPAALIGTLTRTNPEGTEYDLDTPSTTDIEATIVDRVTINAALATLTPEDRTVALTILNDDDLKDVGPSLGKASSWASRRFAQHVAPALRAALTPTLATT